MPAIIKYFFSPSFLLITALRTMVIILDTADVIPIAQDIPSPYNLPSKPKNERNDKSTPSLQRIYVA